MKLTYFVDPQGNFGDDLNQWLWDRAAPGLLDQDDSVSMLGIGTLLGDWFLKNIPGNTRKVCIGSGAGKGGLPILGSDWCVYGVRGPLTAAYLNLPQAKIAADPAVLIHDWPDLYAAPCTIGVGFMPHVWSSRVFDWRSICEDAGLVYVDPEADSIETIRLLGSLDKLVTEAMHGAIVADAVRVPWVATRISTRFDAGKWCDWGASVGIDVKFHHLPELKSNSDGLLRSLRGHAKRAAANLGAPVNGVYTPPSSRADRSQARSALQRLAHSAPVQLSSDEAIRAAVKRVWDALEQAQEDKVAGNLGQLVATTFY